MYGGELPHQPLIPLSLSLGSFFSFKAEQLKGLQACREQSNTCRCFASQAVCTLLNTQSSEFILAYESVCSNKDFPGVSIAKNSPVNTGDVDLIPESGRVPGEGEGNPL